MNDETAFRQKLSVGNLDFLALLTSTLGHILDHHQMRFPMMTSSARELSQPSMSASTLPAPTVKALKLLESSVAMERPQRVLQLKTHLTTMV